MITEINKKMRAAKNASLLHDTKSDVRLLMQMLNLCIDKINEIVALVNKQEKEIKKIKEGQA